jgi:phosphatidylserine decarboxylase
MLGSTVVLLWPKHTIALNRQWAAGQSVRMGEAMGSAR